MPNPNPIGRRPKRNLGGSWTVQLAAEVDHEIAQLAEDSGLPRAEVLRRILAHFWQYNDYNDLLKIVRNGNPPT
ncbi:MAG: ribbon-helix-helix domain-containing protein [Microcoleus sp.]